MTKHAKKHVETPIDSGRSLLEATLDELRGQLKVISNRRKELRSGSFDKDLSMAAAALGRTIDSTVAELRKLEVHDKRFVGNEMSEGDKDAVILSYLVNLPVERREIFIEALASSGPSLLGHDVEPNN